jgi:uroporphyrinogen decarboxylase
VLAATRREAVDRVPYALWRHFPAVDRSPAGLAQATLRFHDRYGADLLVLAPPAGFAAEAWGCVEGETPGPDGTRPCARCAVGGPEDWARIRPVDPGEAPGLVGVLEAVVRVGFDRRLGDAPVLVTLPSPLTVAARLAGGRLAPHLRTRPDAVGAALDAIAATLVALGERVVAEGVAGVLYLVGEDGLDPATRAEVGVPRDRAVLEALAPAAALLALHVAAEGASPLAWADLPVRAFGWDAARRPPPLAEGWRRLPGAVLGGLDAVGLASREPAAPAAPPGVVAEVEAALAATGGAGLIVAPGGPVPPGTPDAVLAAIVKRLGGRLTPVLGISGLTR